MNRNFLNTLLFMALGGFSCTAFAEVVPVPDQVTHKKIPESKPRNVVFIEPPPTRGR